MTKANITTANIIDLVVAGLAGVLFGSGMIISGMVDPNKVIGFLDIFGNWDPSLGFVMGGALLIFAPGYHFLIKPRSRAINGDEIACPSNTKVDGRLISGAAIFGIGWGLVGFCPGPAISSISGGSYIIWTFVAAMLVGMLLANKYIARVTR